MGAGHVVVVIREFLIKLGTIRSSQLVARGVFAFSGVEVPGFCTHRIMMQGGGYQAFSKNSWYGIPSDV